MKNMTVQLVVLGTGDPDTENFFYWLTGAFPGRVGSYIGFSNELSHLVEAGSDFFLMPSLYEPCGLNQSYSLKYATLPIVRATGGLDDTVWNYDEATGAGTGFKFSYATGSALYDAIGWAVSTWFKRPQHIAQLRQEAMAQDFSWSDSARDYVEVYKHALRNMTIPLLTIIGVFMAVAMTGTVLTETVFTRPGLGKMLVDAIGARDYPLAQGAITVFTMMIICVNLLVDILYAAFDPRIVYK